MTIKEKAAQWSGQDNQSQAPIILGECKQGAKRARKFCRIGKSTSMSTPKWLIDSILPKAGLVVLAGQPFGGKSTLAAQMATCVASGLPFFGHDAAQGPVLYLCGERFQSTCVRLSIMSDLAGGEGNLPLFADSPFGLNLVDQHDARTELREIVKLVKDEAGLPPSLIIFDTLSTFIFGHDENSARVMSSAMALLTDLKDSLGATVMILHHMTKPRGTGKAPKLQSVRGSSALTGAADVHLTVADGALTVAASNDGPSGLTWSYKTATTEAQGADGMLTTTIPEFSVQTPEGVDHRLQMVMEALLKEPNAGEKRLEEMTGIPHATAGRLKRRLKQPVLEVAA